jgi:signal transduction histidine kinase
MIQIVFRNLLSNAIKFSHCSGSIVISGTHEGKMTRICLADQGIGIEREVLNDLFSTQVKSSRGTRQEKGTGIGLQLCQQLIRLNQGSIRVDSETGKGTSVHIFFPKFDVTAS